MGVGIYPGRLTMVGTGQVYHIRAERVLSLFRACDLRQLGRGKLQAILYFGWTRWGDNGEYHAIINPVRIPRWQQKLYHELLYPSDRRHIRHRHC